MPRTPYQRTILALSVALAFAFGTWTGIGFAFSAVYYVNGMLVIDCTTDDDCERKNGPMTMEVGSTEPRTFRF